MPTPLYRIADAQPRLGELLTPAISYDSSAVEHEWKQRSLHPEAFEVSDDIAGERVLLIEDTWVTGSTALSTAIALRRKKPQSLALVPIARMVYEVDMTDAYHVAAASPIDFAAYPR